MKKLRKKHGKKNLKLMELKKRMWRRGNIVAGGAIKDDPKHTRDEDCNNKPGRRSIQKSFG